MLWAIDCAVRVLPLTGARAGARLSATLEVAASWAEGEASVGEAQKAAWRAHAAARSLSDPAAVYAARAVGHACATAHMADHSLGAALYALKARQAADRPIEAEKRLRLGRPPAVLRPLVGQALREKGRPWGYNGAVRSPAKSRSGEAAMGMINKDWHLANRMPKNPTHEQRMAWHIEHAANCRCHSLTDKLKAEIAEFKKRGRKA